MGRKEWLLKKTSLNKDQSMYLFIIAPILESISNPPGGADWSWGQCGCHRDPPVRPNSKSAEFRASVVLNHSCYVVLGLNWP